MREGWTLTPLGTVTTQVIEPVDLRPDVEYRNLGVKWYAAGTFLRQPKPGRDIKATRLFRVHPGQFVYNRLFATEGSFALVRPDDAEAVASNEFPVFDVDTSRLLPEYLYLHFQQQAVWQEVNRQCTGTTKSRLRWKEERFRAFALSLPPIREQRRIVDLIGALDHAIEATDAARRAETVHLRRQRSLVFDSLETAPARDMFDILIGVQRNPTRATGDSQTHYLRSANVGSGVLDLADVYKMSISGAERAKYALQMDDVLVSEGSASETAVGAPCRWRGEIDGTVCFQNTLLRYRSRSGRTTPGFVEHWCAWAHDSGAFREVAGGSNIKHIGARRAELMPVAAIPFSEQRNLLAPIEAAAEALRASETHMRSLQALRATALTALLSGEHEIPESYDNLLEVAS